MRSNDPGVELARLDELDFSEEKDKTVLRSLLHAAKDVKDNEYVDRFQRLVQRTDLYNDTRRWVACMMAEIGGERSWKAIHELQFLGNYDRLLPVLERMHTPPATGLLVMNSRPAGPARIGLYDVLVEYNGHRIRTRADLTLADATTTPGDVVTAKVLHNGAEQILNITVTDTAPGHLHFDAMPIVEK